jgi:hypothetical protein
VVRVGRGSDDLEESVRRVVSHFRDLAANQGGAASLADIRRSASDWRRPRPMGKRSRTRRRAPSLSRPPPSRPNDRACCAAVRAGMLAEPSRVFFSHRRDHRQYRHWEPVTLEDGTVEFRPTIGTLAVEAAFAEIFGPQPEDGE